MWEGSTLSLLPDPERVRNFGADAYAIAFARIECHYFVNGGFFASDGQLLADAGGLRDIPGTIVHGRYDVVTPVKNAWDLKAAWPTAELRIVADAGHAMSEPGIVHELVAATRRYRRGAAGDLAAERAEEVEHHLAPVRPVAVLDDVDALPGAEQHRAGLHRDRQRRCRQRRLDVGRHVVGPFDVVHVGRGRAAPAARSVDAGRCCTSGSAFSWIAATPRCGG